VNINSTGSDRMSQTNISSKLLSSEENSLIFSKIGLRSCSIATAVVQLFLTPRGQHQWRLKTTGVACFVRDSARRGFFIQVKTVKIDTECHVSFSANIF